MLFRESKAHQDINVLQNREADLMGFNNTK